MKDYLCVTVADDGDVSVTTDYEFLTAGSVDRNNPFYQKLVAALREGPGNCLDAIRVLESARKDARYHYQGLHPELEKALLAWRRNKALEQDVPAYYILHQRVLLGIADAAPASADALLSLPGFGPGLLARYGDELLAIVRNT